MKTRTKTSPLVLQTAFFSGLGILAFLLADVSTRTPLKDGISLLTLVGFFLLIGQCYSTRFGKRLLSDCRMSTIMKFHEYLGYLFSVVILVHPLLIALPRYFEAGVSPEEVFIIIVTTTTTGIQVGIAAWILLAVLVGTAFFRSRLGMSYKAWRIMHGFLSVFFLLFASYHVIDLGRHMTLLVSFLLIIVTAGTITLFLRQFVPEKKFKLEGNYEQLT